MERERQTVFIIHFLEGYLGIAPTVVGLADELALRGHAVDIRVLPSDFPPPGDLHRGCRMTSLSPARKHKLIRGLFSLLPRIKLGSLIQPFEMTWLAVQTLALDVRRYGLFRRPKCVAIGVDARGVMLAWMDCVLLRQKYVNLSLELMPPTVYRWAESVLRMAETSAMRRASAVLIQDPERLGTLRRYFPQMTERAFFLPNAPRDDDGESSSKRSRDFFWKRLNLPRDRFPHLIVQAGMIRDEVYARELAQAFSRVPDGFALVYHERERRDRQDPYLQGLLAGNDRNLFLSLEPVPLDQVDEVFASITIGVAFYRPVDENFGQIAFASGKLSYYLKHGIPVLMNRLPSFESLNSVYQIGVVVDDPGNADELTAVLGTIIGDYETYSRNARCCFMEEFEFSAKCRPIVSFLESL
jgi:hypothetical protein